MTEPNGNGQAALLRTLDAPSFRGAQVPHGRSGAPPGAAGGEEIDAPRSDSPRALAGRALRHRSAGDHTHGARRLAGVEEVMTVTPLRLEPRPAQTPIANAATGTVAGGIGQAAAYAIAASNPEIAWAAPFIGTAITGVLNGAGNAARTRISTGQPGLGLVVANLFAWLG